MSNLDVGTCADLERKNEQLNERLELIPALQEKVAEQQRDIATLEDRLHESRQRLSTAALGSSESMARTEHPLFSCVCNVGGGLCLKGFFFGF